jgi:hypothetical protein
VLFAKALKPGGVYFIEDMLTSRWPSRYYDQEPDHLVMMRMPDVKPHV